jgi:VIT1/CCC1 family predicted Fe2+/Mn2+ transporter
MKRTRPDTHHHDGHRDITGGAARAAVFGVSDGLTTNVALILGVAGANPAPGIVRLAGLAGLIGGAFSMAAGEWVSMRAQAELLERELAVERRALARAPESEKRELVGIYRKRGIDRDTAEAMATQVMADPDRALEVHAREEMGVNPDSLGSPTKAAGSSFLTFAIGALVPLIPWFAGHGGGAVVASLILAAVAAMGVGAALARFTGKSILFSGLRQLGIAAVASAVTYGVGALVGAH